MKIVISVLGPIIVCSTCTGGRQSSRPSIPPELLKHITVCIETPLLCVESYFASNLCENNQLELIERISHLNFKNPGRKETNLGVGPALFVPTKSYNFKMDRTAFNFLLFFFSVQP